MIKNAIDFVSRNGKSLIRDFGIVMLYIAIVYCNSIIG